MIIIDIGHDFREPQDSHWKCLQPLSSRAGMMYNSKFCLKKHESKLSIELCCLVALCVPTESCWAKLLEIKQIMEKTGQNSVLTPKYISYLQLLLSLRSCNSKNVSVKIITNTKISLFTEIFFWPWGHYQNHVHRNFGTILCV